MTRFDNNKLVSLLQRASIDVRKRAPQPMHQDEFEGPQALINAIEPGSYVRPHKHLYKEIWVPLHGKGNLLYFTETGEFTESITLSPVDVVYEEVPEERYHGFVAEVPTVFLNISQGPYNPNSKISAPWAPEELKQGAEEYFERLKRLIGRD